LSNKLVELAKLAEKRVADGYYDTNISVGRRRASLVTAIRGCKLTPVITEIKYASPSAGMIRGAEPALKIASEMIAGGACALSILTDPNSFQGGLHMLAEVAVNTRLPLIMKDIIVSPRQLRAAANYGADAVVLISELFTERLALAPISVMREEAARLNLETVIEAHDSSEFGKIPALKPDLYGINNRNLSSFEIDLETTRRILSETKPQARPVISESGIETAGDIELLKVAGAQAFLVGTSIMKSPDVEGKVRELVNA
jgi:indole-3-glycerol phosphate synthase